MPKSAILQMGRPFDSSSMRIFWHLISKWMMPFECKNFTPAQKEFIGGQGVSRVSASSVVSIRKKTSCSLYVASSASPASPQKKMNRYQVGNI